LSSAIETAAAAVELAMPGAVVAGEERCWCVVGLLKAGSTSVRQVDGREDMAERTAVSRRPLLDITCAAG